MELIKLAAAAILCKYATSIPQRGIDLQMIARWKQQQALRQKLMQQQMMQQQMMQQAAKPTRPDMQGAKFPWIGPSLNIANMKPAQQVQQQLQGQKFGG